MDAELKKFEEELERLAPQPLPEGLIARMEAAMEDWQDSDEKVVPFPARSDRGMSRGGFLKAVAAVAVLGAALAFVLPESLKNNSRPTAESGQPPNAILAGISPAAFSPQDAKRSLMDAADQGVVVTRDSRPHRVLRVETIDRYRFQNAKGEVLYVERPRVEYILIPVGID